MGELVTVRTDMAYFGLFEREHTGKFNAHDAHKVKLVGWMINDGVALKS